uniref:Uncharacterized protein n=1 Tax=Molossus molossus TaxID=27622 RepID=A0A7J8FA68_MOLMO|nr:hypothetical protein HJG59_008579 [Molossus molossus]
MGNTATRSLNYWQYTFCHQPKVECSQSFSVGCRFHSTGVSHLFGSCKKITNLPDLPSSYEYVSQQRPPENLSVGFLEKCALNLSGDVLGGSSPQNSLRMSSCGWEVMGRPHGDEGAPLGRTEAERGPWSGEGRNEDTGHL